MIAEDKTPGINTESDVSPGAKDALKREFARRLHQAMRAKDWRQSDLARASGMPKDSISQYYNGKIFPTAFSLEKVARALGVQPTDLMPGATDPSPVGQAVPRDFGPVVEDVPGSPNLKRVRVSRVVSAKTAGAIFNLFVSDADGE